MKLKKNGLILIGLELLLVLSIVLFVFLPLNPIGKMIPSQDSGVFLYSGWRIVNGEIPYLQVWDHKPPIIYYIDAVSILLTPNSGWGLWYLEVFFFTLAGYAGYRVLKTLFGMYTAIIISFLWILTSSYLLAGGNLTTEYTVPFQLLILLLFLAIQDKDTIGWKGILLGILSGLLFFTRQNAIAIPAAIASAWAVQLFLPKKFKINIKKLILMGAGFLVITGGFVLYYYSKGALFEFWKIAFLYNIDYVEEKNTIDRVNALLQGLNQLANIGLAQLALLGWGSALLYSLFDQKSSLYRFRNFFIAVLIALPLELILISAGGRPRIPYFLTALPIMAVFAGFTISLIFDQLNKFLPIYAKSLFTVFVVIMIGSVFISDFTEIIKSNRQVKSGSKIVQYIQDNSNENDYVLMWGANSAINFATRRKSPSRYVYQTPLYNSKASDPVIEFLTDLTLNKPRLIVLPETDKFSDFRFGYRGGSVGGLMDNLKSMYKRTGIIQNWIIYQYVGN